MNKSQAESSDSSRLSRLMLLTSWIATAWLLFLWTHESGHILAAIFTGGRIEQVVLHPLAFSRTDVFPNPSPMIVAWAGACLGPIVAAIVFGFFKLVPKHGAVLYQSLLGFILIANGCYIGLGVIQPVGDASDMLRLGSPTWLLAIYGLIACSLGLKLWSGVNPIRLFQKYGSQADFHAAGTLLIIASAFAISGAIGFPA